MKESLLNKLVYSNSKKFENVGGKVRVLLNDNLNNFMV